MKYLTDTNQITYNKIFLTKYIVAVVENTLGLNPGDVLLETRLRTIMDGKHIARYIISKSVDISFPAIADIVNCDHASVSHSLRIFNELLSNRMFRDKIRLVCNALIHTNNEKLDPDFIYLVRSEMMKNIELLDRRTQLLFEYANYMIHTPDEVSMEAVKALKDVIKEINSKFGITYYNKPELKITINDTPRNKR